MSGEGLVVYYSRTGNTEKVGESMASKLDYGARKIIDKKDRSGISGYMKGGWDAWRENLTEIDLRRKEEDLSNYELIVIGTPVWAGKPTPAVRTYLSEKKEEIEEIAFFCTMGGSGYERTFQHLEEISGKEPVSTLAVREKEIEDGTYERAVKNFVEECSRI
ncbi:MAG: hypothetical protein V5A88_03345 [Candidatus Thermoplasmatota archaeon]